LFADTTQLCGSFERSRPRTGAGWAAGRDRRGGVERALLAVRARRAWGRAATAMVAALAAACVIAPAAQATIPGSLQVAWQGSNGSLWYWNNLEEKELDLQAGMMAGTSPSINNWGDVAFQANTGSLDVTGRGELKLGMMKGTSPSMDDNGQVVFQANTGELMAAGGTSCNCSWHLGMMAGTSPSIAHQTGNGGSQDNHIAFQANSGTLWDLFAATPATGLHIDSGTSPSINEVGEVAFQRQGSLWKYDPKQGGSGGKDLQAGMARGTSPSMDAYGNVAFQGNNGHLWITSTDPSDTGFAMAPGTSPSMDQYGNVAFHGSNGKLWFWDAGSGFAGDCIAGPCHQQMAPGTSPSIGPGVTLHCCGKTSPRPTSVVGGGSPDDDRLSGDSANNLIRGGDGDDLIRGGAGNDRVYGGAGNDRVYGGPGNDRHFGGAGDDRVYGGPGTDLIVDHRGATTAFPGSGANVVNVEDGRGDDRVVCKRNTITDWFADPRDRISRSCYDRLRQPRRAS
jgi:RTX calcium-binding nonapeptide repeat (4 copies)